MFKSKPTNTQIKNHKYKPYAQIISKPTPQIWTHNSHPHLRSKPTTATPQIWTTHTPPCLKNQNPITTSQIRTLHRQDREREKKIWSPGFQSSPRYCSFRWRSHPFLKNQNPITTSQIRTPHPQDRERNFFLIAWVLLFAWVSVFVWVLFF